MCFDATILGNWMFLVSKPTNPLFKLGAKVLRCCRGKKLERGEGELKRDGTIYCYVPNPWCYLSLYTCGSPSIHPFAP